MMVRLARARAESVAEAFNERETKHRRQAKTRSGAEGKNKG
jgi:hypothetical protein